MEIKSLVNRTDLDHNGKLKQAYTQFAKFISELKKKDIPAKTVSIINDYVEQVNSTSSSGNELRQQIRVSQSKIIKLAEKELKVVPKNYYRNTWLAGGMGVFGVPLGLTLPMIFGNMALMAAGVGIGLPIGMAIGLIIGTGLDKKAFREGRQLDVELKS